MKVTTKDRLKKTAERKKNRLRNVDVSLSLSISKVLAVLLIGGAAWYAFTDGVTITAEQKLLAAATVGIGLVLSPAVVWLTSKIFTGEKVFVIEVNVAKRNCINVWYGAPSLWDDVDVVSGQAYEYYAKGYSIKVVTNFAKVGDVDPDSEFADHIPDHVSGYVAAGTWLGEAGDREIVGDRRKIQKNRRRNQLWAKFGEVLYDLFEDVADRTEKAHHKNLQDKSMELNLFDGGDTVKSVLADEIPEFQDIDESDNISEIIETEVAKQIEAENTRQATQEVSTDE